MAQQWKRKYERGPSTIAVTDRDEDFPTTAPDFAPQLATIDTSTSQDHEQKAMPSSAASAGGSNGHPKPTKPGSSSGKIMDGPSTTPLKPPLNSIKSSRKVAPEDQPPPKELTRQEQAIQFAENKYMSTALTLCTLFALFGDDIRVLCPKSADTPIYHMLFICLLLFLAELGVNVYARPNYFMKGRGGAFYLDLVSTLSVIPDIGWIWSHVVGTSSGTSSSSQAAALKAGRASRMGTRASRIVRLVRLFRMLRILRAVKGKNKDEEVKVEISEPSKIGKVLTEKTTRRLVLLVLSIIILSPIIDGSVDQTQDDFQVSQLERLHRYTQDYNATGQITDEHYRRMIEQYVRDSNGLIVEMSLHHVDNATLNSWLSEIKFQPLDSDDEWTFTAPYTLTSNPKNGWSADKYLVSDPAEEYRSDEYTVVENYGCYQNNVCIDCSSGETVGSCHSWVTFDIQRFAKETAWLNIGKTIVVIFCLGISIFVLTKDAETMVIGPIERMMRLVTQLAENPLGATEAKKELHEVYADEKTADDYETKMLEQTLGKIGRLLQVGFGAAGTEIIKKNMGGAGDLDVMIPGKKITSIFGFGIIEHFTETCSILEEDVITYINTIAEIVHSDAKIFHGAANKNIGAAFLLAWKMCDGALPGMRDPRDAADKPRMDPVEKAKKREGIFVMSTGDGTVARRISPQELVDSALTAVLKMRVDLHNANHHGTLAKYCTNKKLVTAFDGFEVHLGFGLHLGWAIEGAIGSKYKIDASYLSPNVNMAARLEAATGQFDVPMLISEWFVDELSASAKKMCRRIDRVMVKGSEIPMDLWTFDIGHYPVEGVAPTILPDGTQKPVEFGSDAIFKILQETIPRGFYDNFNEGIGAYFSGKWDIAQDKLTAANQIWEDGPTKVVLRVMENQSQGTFVAPGWWKGYRQLTEK